MLDAEGPKRFYYSPPEPEIAVASSETVAPRAFGLWRCFAGFLLGVLAYVPLPSVATYSAAVMQPLVARAIVAACVAGLIGCMIRPRWVVPAIASSCVLRGFLILGVFARRNLNLTGFALGFPSPRH